MDDRARAGLDGLTRHLLLAGWARWRPVLGWSAPPTDVIDPQLDGPLTFLSAHPGFRELLLRRINRHEAGSRLRDAAALAARHADTIRHVDLLEELISDQDPAISAAAQRLLSEAAAAVDLFGGLALAPDDLPDEGKRALLHALAAWRRLDLAEADRAAHDRAVLEWRFGSSPGDGEASAAASLAAQFAANARVTPELAIDSLADSHVALFESLVATLLDVPASTIAIATPAALVAALVADQGQAGRLALLLARARYGDEDEAGQAAVATLDAAHGLDAIMARDELLLAAAPAYRRAIAAAERAR